MDNFCNLAFNLVEQIFDQGIVQWADQKIPSPRRVELQLGIRRVPQQAGRVVNLLQRKLVEALPASAKLKSDVLARSIRRHRVGTGAVSSSSADLQRQIKFYTRPVLMRPKLVVGRSKRIQ